MIAAEETVPMRTFARFLPAVPLVGAVAASLLVFSPMPGFAQYGRTFHTMVKPSPSDVAIMRKIVREDFTGKPKGTTESWKNPESQNSGTITLLDRFESKGRDCRRARYIIHPGPQQLHGTVTADYVLTSCKLPDGTWKLDSSARP
jgi:hypothetical protein